MEDSFDSESSVREIPANEKISIVTEFKINNPVRSNSNTDRQTGEKRINLIPDEDYGYDPRERDAAFEKYYHKVEKKNIMNKQQEYLAKLQHLTKIKSQIKEERLSNYLKSVSLTEIRRKNEINLGKYNQDKLSALQFIADNIKNEVKAHENRIEGVIQNVRNDFGLGF